MPSAVALSPSPVSAPPAAPDRRAGRAATAWLLALITLAAAILRFHGLAAKPFWLDEALSVEIARMPWLPLLRRLWHREANMALYYLLLRFWLDLGGSAAFIRALSVLFSVATVPVVYALGARLFGRRAGLLAAWLLAINAFHVRYAQEARGYAMVVFFAAVATWLLVRNLQEPASAHWGAYTAACVLAVYSQFFGALVVLVHLASLSFLRREDVPWRKVARSFLWFSGLMIPLAIFVVKAGAGPLNWVPQTTSESLLHFWVIMAGNDGPWLLAGEAMAAGLAAFAAWRAWRGEQRTLDGWGYALVLAWLFFPVALTMAASVVRPVFMPRYLIPCLPALALIVAAGIARLRPVSLGFALCAAISVLSVLGTVSYYHWDFDASRYDWPAVTSYILDHAQPGDGVFFYQGGAQAPFEFYRSQRHPAPVWPETLNPWDDRSSAYKDYLDVPAGSDFRAARATGDRIWLVLYLPAGPHGEPDRKGAMVRDWFAKGRRRVDVQRFPPIGILLFSRDTDGSLRSAQN